MIPLKRKVQLTAYARFRLLNIAKLILGLTIFSLLFPASIQAEELVNYAPDLIPPQITIVSPFKDSVTDTGAPSIAVLFSDIGSDIDETSIHLILDRIDVTAQAKIERADITGQASNSPREIIYQPSVPLAQGKHEITFSVRDLAGNPAEIHWSFEVKSAVKTTLRVGGDNILQFGMSPIYKTSDTLNLTIQGQIRETDIRFHLLGQATDYHRSTPLIGYKDYNLYCDKYSLGFYHQKASLVLGYASASLDSELIQIGLEVEGAVAGTTIDNHTGEYTLSAFSGKAASTYSLGIAVYDVSGLGGKWFSPSGSGLGAFYVNLGGASGYDFAGLKGNTFLGTSLLQFEAIYGASKTGNKSGNGLALHLEQPVATSVIGLDYTVLQPGYPIPGSPPTLAPNDFSHASGTQRYVIRSVTVMSNGQSINFNSSFTNDNLDQSLNHTNNRQNISIGYNFNPKPGFSFNANYQGDFQYKKQNLSVNEKQINNTVALGIQQKFEKSMFHSSLSLQETQPTSGESSNQIHFFSAWTKNLSAYNLIPSIQWTDEKKSNGDHTGLSDTRLTFDIPLHPDLSRSKIAFFFQNTNGQKNNQPIHKTDIGLASTVYMMLWRKSMLTLTFNCSRWTREDPGYTAGWNTTFNLTWKTNF